MVRYKIVDESQEKDKPLEVSLGMDGPCWVALKINGEFVVGVGPKGALHRYRDLDETKLPGIELDSSGRVCLDE